MNTAQRHALRAFLLGLVSMLGTVPALVLAFGLSAIASAGVTTLVAAIVAIVTYFTTTLEDKTGFSLFRRPND